MIAARVCHRPHQNSVIHEFSSPHVGSSCECGGAIWTDADEIRVKGKQYEVGNPNTETR